MSDTNREYAMLLLSKTRLTYNQISDLTGLSMNKIYEFAQKARPKKIRDENTMLGTKPDVHEELLKLKEELQSLQIELPLQETPLVFDRRMALHYQLSTKPLMSLDKSFLLEELEAIKEKIESMEVTEVSLSIRIEGA